MNAALNSPTWATAPAKSGTVSASMRQLVNAAGPISTGIAVSLSLVQRSKLAEADGEAPVLSATERAQLVEFCALAAQMLGDVVQDAANDLVSQGG